MPRVAWWHRRTASTDASTSLRHVARVVGLLAGLTAAGCLTACATGTPGAVGLPSSSVATTSAATQPEPTSSQDTYCAAMRQIADFERALRRAGQNEASVTAVYWAANSDHGIEDAYARAATAVPVEQAEVHVGLNYGELFTGRIAADLAEGIPFPQANAPRSDPDWVSSQADVNGYTKQVCSFVVYKG
jgi:hypothetical protein